MTNPTHMSYACLNCSRSENEIPLVSLRYAGGQAWICSQCLPTLIHKPEQLTTKLTRLAQYADDQ